MEIINPIVAEIDRRAQLQNYNLTSLAKAAGLAGTTLTKMAKEPVGSPSRATLKKVAAVLDCSHLDFDIGPKQGHNLKHGLGDNLKRGSGDVRPARVRISSLSHTLKDLPVKGLAAGALTAHGFEITEHVVEYINRPPALEGSPDAFAMRVIGESMAPLHRRGDLCIVHPHRPYKRGDSIVITIMIIEKDEPVIENYIKTFLRESADAVFCEQYNPPLKIEYRKSSVVAIGKVLTVAELFGAA